MLILQHSVSASITGFENPCAPYLDNTLNLQTLLIGSPSSTRIVPAPNNLLSQGVAKGDWLIVNAGLSPLRSDVLLARSFGDEGVVTFEHLHRLGDHEDVQILGVVQQSIHFYPGPRPILSHDSLLEFDLHKTLFEVEYATLLASASGDSMKPHIWDGDMMIIERHIQPQDHDVAVLGLNGDLVLKRLDMSRRQLLSDNPCYAPHHLTSSDRLSSEGTVRKVIRLHRPPCIV